MQDKSKPNPQAGRGEPQEVKLVPGWLRRDVDRAIARVNEWEGKAHAPAVSGEGWPLTKKAIWDALAAENLNDGHYIKLEELTERVFQSVTRHSPASPSVEGWKKAKGRVAHWIERLAAGIDSDPDITFERIESELQSAGIIPAARGG